MVLQLYLQGLVIAAIVVVLLSGLYLFAYLVRSGDKAWYVRRNRIFDVILVDLLTIPVLSFAILGLLIILRVRAM